MITTPKRAATESTLRTTRYNGDRTNNHRSNRTRPRSHPHWLRLANLPFSSKLIAALLECFDNDPQAIFSASDRKLDSIPIFQARHLVTLRKPKYEAMERQLALYQRFGVRLILPSHPEYPPALGTIPDPSPFLFVRGTLVGIVGPAMRLNDKALSSVQGYCSSVKSAC